MQRQRMRARQRPAVKMGRPVAATMLMTLGTAVVVRDAHADNPNSAAAQGLFEEARRLMGDAQYKDACPKLEESQRLDPGSGTLLNLADCYEHVGKLATAWSKFPEAAALARNAGNRDREQAARSRAAALKPRLSNVVITVSTPATRGLEISRDGELVGQPQWGVAIPTDEGTHSIAAKAPGRKPWQGQAVVQGEGTTATVTVPQLEVGPPEPEAGAGPKPGRSAVTGQRTIALVCGGIGIVGLGLGSAFGLISKSKHNESDKYCGAEGCWDSRGVEAMTSARSAGNVSTAAFVVGGVGLAVGAALWLTVKSNAQTLSLGLRPGDLQVRGTW